MGYKCSFMDNELYTAQDVNERFSCFLSEGVALGESGNTLRDLNDLTKNLASGGVMKDSCKVVCENGVYKISQGSCFMQDGSAITFDQEGYLLDVTPYVHQYVYLMRNEPHNTIDIVCSQEEPPASAIRLAEITDGGSIYDKRQYAKLNMNSTQEGTMKTFYNEFYYSEDFQPIENDAGTGNLSYIIIWYGYYGLGEGSTDVDCSGRCIRVVNDDAPMEFNIVDIMGNTRFRFNVTKSGNILKTSIVPTSRTKDYAICFGVI